MSIDPLVQIVHSLQQAEWSKRNEDAFEALFGSPEGRYPRAAKSSVTLRAPEMSADSGVPFAAYIHPSNPSKGAYGGLSFVIFPVADAPCLVGLLVGTQGLSPDEAILGRPGHARKAQAICAWLNQEFAHGEQIAWAKQDPTRTDINVPENLQREWSAYKSVFDRYGRVMYALFKPAADDKITRDAITALLDLCFEERRFPVNANQRDDSDRIRAKWFSCLMPVATRAEVRKLLAARRFVILQGPPGTGKTTMALELLSEDYGGIGAKHPVSPEHNLRNFCGRTSSRGGVDAAGPSFPAQTGVSYAVRQRC